MLSDVERKIFIIFRNITRKHKPTVDEICRITGKSQEEITRVLLALHDPRKDLKPKTARSILKQAGLLE